MPTFSSPWLSEDEVLFHRMESFHHERVDALGSGQSPLGTRDSGILVLHLIPRSAVQSRFRFDGAKLKEHGRAIPAFSERTGYSRFNTDGLLNYEGREHVRAYSQLFRDGRLEAAMGEVTFPVDRQQQSVVCLRDSICEKGAQQTVGEYLRFCKAIGLTPPVGMFSALIGCKGVRLWTNRGFYEASEHAIERSPVFLPDIEIGSFDVDPVQLLRPWGDALWQACGMERSFNFDDAGNWRERR